MKYDQENSRYILSDFEHISNFIEKEEANAYLQRLESEVPWEKVKWSTGRDLPRLVYRYDEYTRIQKECSILEELIFLVEEVFETYINGVWCNLYRNGQDWCPYHQDNYNFHVLTLSFGQQRDFKLREKGNTSSTQTFRLSHGDAYYFTPEINETHEHSIPKSTKSLSTRISIVFFMNRPYSRREKVNTGFLSSSTIENGVPIMIRDSQIGVLKLNPSFEGKVPTEIQLGSYQALNFLSMVLSAQNLHGQVIIF